MIQGRHFVLLGIMACAGLISVHYGQRQIDLFYKLGSVERDLRGTRSGLALAELKHRALQAPTTVADKVTELKLKVAPVVTSVVPPSSPPVVHQDPSHLPVTPRHAPASVVVHPVSGRG